MTQSLFFAFFIRLVLAMGLMLVARAWLLPSGWVLATLLVFGWASVNALLLVWSIRRSVRPLENAAELLAASAARRGGQPEGDLSSKLRERMIEQRYSDFDGVARALAQAGREVERALAAVAGSRRELEAMVDSMSEAVVAVDAAGRIQWTNERMQRLLPPSGAQLSGSGPVRIGQSLVQTVRDPDVLACVRMAIDGRVLSEARSTSLVPGRIFDVTVSPVPAGGAVAVLRDVTRIEQVERTQRDFVANVSHELRTPLTSITGYVETLLDNERLSEVAQQFLRTILKNAARMTRLTDDLLTMARVESDEQKLRPAPVPAELLVLDAVSAVRGLLQESDATLEVGPVSARRVMADSDATVQVLTNLIENAVKYGRGRATGSSRVVVSARELEVPSPAVEFSVTDFGPGIASEHIPRIFDRFYRVDKARSIETGGTGLGLAIARHIVEAQAGSIRVESVLNQGSSFMVTLPAAGPEPEVQA